MDGPSWSFNETSPLARALKAVLAQQIDKLTAAGVTDFYTGMALGVDTWAAMDVLDLRERNMEIKLHCILPCEGRDAAWSSTAQLCPRASCADVQE